MFDACVCAHEGKDPVGFVSVRRPDFLAIDEVVVALVFTLGLKVCKVRAGAWFRITLTPADFAAHDLRQVLFLLFFVGKFKKCRAKHPDAEAHESRAGFDAPKFLLQDFVFIF